MRYIKGEILSVGRDRREVRDRGIVVIVAQRVEELPIGVAEIDADVPVV